MARKNKTQRQAELAAAVAIAAIETAPEAIETAPEAIETAPEAIETAPDAFLAEVKAGLDALDAEEAAEDAEAAAEAAAEAGDPLEAIFGNRSAVPLRYRKEYAKRALPNTCSDDLAFRLDRLTKGSDGKVSLIKLRLIGDLNGIDVDARWGSRNPGMQRMNLGNVLRGRAKRGEAVILGDEAPVADEQAA